MSDKATLLSSCPVALITFWSTSIFFSTIKRNFDYSKKKDFVSTS